mgnify:CR=1 FL=1
MTNGIGVLNLLEILKVWEGGMSFHGGLIGIVFAIFFFCKKNHLDFFYLSSFY